MPLHYPPIRLGQQPSNHHGSSSGGLYHHQGSSTSLLSREDSSIDICITGEKSHFVRQHSGRSNSQTPRLANHNIRNIASPIPHPINASSFNTSTTTTNQHHQTVMNNSASINTNGNNIPLTLDSNLSSILKEHLDESLINFLQQNPQLIDSSAISLLNLVNKHASSNNQQVVQPQTTLPEHTSNSQHQGIPNLTVNNSSMNNEAVSSSEPKITIIREYKQHMKPTTKTKKKPKYVPPTMDKAVRKKEDRLCALVVPNKQSVEFPDEFEFNEKHKSFIYNPEPTKTSFLERLSFLDSKKSRDRSLNYSISNQKEGNPIELFSNNDISYYNKSDFLLASEKFVKTEKERNNGTIPQWNKITDNIPMGFIDDLNADYIIQPVDRSNSVIPEEVEEAPAERETFFITGLDETNNTNNSILSKTQKSNTQKSEMPELPSRISTPNYVLFSRDGTNLSQMSQHSQRSVSPNVSVNLSRPHSTLSYHSVPSNNYLSNHSLIYQENAPPRPNTSMNVDRTAVLSAKKKWNVFPPRQKIIVNNPNKPINSFVAEQSMNLYHSSSSRMDFSRSATPLSTLRAKSSMSSRSGYSINTSQSHDSSEQEEIVIRLPDQCLISATSKPIISKPTPIKQHSIFNKSQDRTCNSINNRDLLNISPINNQ
ncbi:predicted protein [Naegleria gruberi]|uniref:Predicted protein n=1 Tax=Naegleria gruberi TaxID=5762 RepID=D2W112_NAEGR|nr:uncharacterized protein NAEGRDRAFT_81990 [Naegleria gruberi]EFC37234.1 predicted protein [Naegleria gruberi]|eukprot:XP_002669978.1 predicted protein [Naegleria gruberi strain NEG-M]